MVELVGGFKDSDCNRYRCIEHIISCLWQLILGEHALVCFLTCSWYYFSSVSCVHVRRYVDLLGR